MTNDSFHRAPEVSVVIPTRNRTELLLRALRSVFGQTIDRSTFEVIVVDDASDEDLSESLRDFDLVYVRNACALGGAASRNAGIARAQGSYIAFLDDDDEWHPEKLGIQLSFMQREHYDFTSTGFDYYDEHKRLIRTYLGVDYRRNHLRALLKANDIGTASTVMIRRDVLESCGAFDPQYEALQDYELWTKLIARGVRYHCINQVLVKYYLHSNIRISHRPFDVYRASVRYYFDHRATILRHGLRRYWLAYLIRLKAELFRPATGECTYRRSILKAYRIDPTNLRRLALYCTLALRAIAHLAE